MTLEITAVNLPDLLAALGMLALAGLLLWAAPRHRAHRAFALLLVVYAFGSLAFVADVGFARTDPALSSVFSFVGIYAVLSWPFASAFFALRFLDPEGRAAASRPVAWSSLAATVAVLAWYAADHDALVRALPEGTILLGPLGIAWFMQAVSPGLVAFVFVWAAGRPVAADRRAGLLLAAAAFTLLSAYWSTFQALGAFLSGDPLTSIVGPVVGPPSTLLLAQAMLWVGPASVVATLALALRAPLRDDRAARRARAVLLGAAAVTAATAAGVAVLVGADAQAFAAVPFAVDGALRVGMTVLLAVALLNRPVLGAETRLRVALSKSTVAAVFIAIFFIASETAQQFLGATLGSTYVGIAAAGMLVFAIAPLQRAAERLAERAVPGTTATTYAPAVGGWTQEERYRSALRLALRDRRLTRAEEIELHRLAEGLGIPTGRAHELLVDVERETGGGGP